MEINQMGHRDLWLTISASRMCMVIDIDNKFTLNNQFQYAWWKRVSLQQCVSFVCDPSKLTPLSIRIIYIKK